jgi:tRNA dimethylallyltransferase
MDFPKADLPLVAIVGPTASGKSALAAALGEQLPGEVVNADSVQVYRHFDIGSGKPSASERAVCPHHLFDIADPLRPLDAAAWAERATEVVLDIRARGRVPIICGGTFLWVRALLYGLAAAPKGDEARRREHRDFVATHGPAALHARLALVDAASAARLHQNDVVRVSRALEVFELTGRPLSAFHDEHGFRTPRFPHRLVAVDWEREVYERRVEVRVRQMMAEGFVEEVEQLKAAGYGEARAMRTVGYKQVAAALAAGELDREALTMDIVRATRVFARRQRTWLRDEPVLAVDTSVLADADALRKLAADLRTRVDTLT